MRKVLDRFGFELFTFIVGFSAPVHVFGFRKSPGNSGKHEEKVRKNSYLVKEAKIGGVIFIFGSHLRVSVTTEVVIGLMLGSSTCAAE